MKILLLATIALFAILAGCSTNDDDETKLTYSSLTGVWKVTDYMVAGKSVFAEGDYSNNYFLVDTNRTFSTRLGAINANHDDTYFCGNMNMSGNDLGLFPCDFTGKDTTTLHVEKITDSQLVFKSAVNNANEEWHFSKVTNPATYQAANKSSGLCTTYSFYYDTEVKDLCYHGTLKTGNNTTDKIFTEKQKIFLVLKGLTTYMETVYPKEIKPGENNIFALYDTTSVYSFKASAFPAEGLNMGSFSQPMKLVDAMKQ